jgi:hypothetical protein
MLITPPFAYGELLFGCFCDTPIVLATCHGHSPSDHRPRNIAAVARALPTPPRPAFLANYGGGGGRRAETKAALRFFLASRSRCWTATPHFSESPTPPRRGSARDSNRIKGGLCRWRGGRTECRREAAGRGRSSSSSAPSRKGAGCASGSGPGGSTSTAFGARRRSSRIRRAASRTASAC